jgi:hypothetical protein
LANDRSGDTAGKVVGQSLLYYVAALELGLQGIELLRQFARRNQRRAKRASPKSLQMLSGGLPRDHDWLALKAGRKLRPSEIALVVGLSEEPRESLRPMLSALRKHHRIDITVVIASGHRGLKMWRAV